MNKVDLLGFVGVSMILIAYFLNLNGKIQSSDIRYILLNLFGATLACMASLLMEYYPFVLLEGTWTLVSIVALVKYLNHKKDNWATGNRRNSDLNNRQGTKTNSSSKQRSSSNMIEKP